MSIETEIHDEEKEKKDDEKGLIEHLIEMRNIVGRVMSGDVESGSGVSSTVGHRRFDPQNQTARQTVVTDDSATSDDSGNPPAKSSDDD
jgi:hypothetical protein